MPLKAIGQMNIEKWQGQIGHISQVGPLHSFCIGLYNQENHLHALDRILATSDKIGGEKNTTYRNLHPTAIEII